MTIFEPLVFFIFSNKQYHFLTYIDILSFERVLHPCFKNDKYSVK